jgi:hypothetical protein
LATATINGGNTLTYTISDLQSNTRAGLQYGAGGSGNPLWDTFLVTTP